MPYNRSVAFSSKFSARYLVYNLRKRGGDSADKYLKSTEIIAGGQDMRFQGGLLRSDGCWLVAS